MNRRFAARSAFSARETPPENGTFATNHRNFGTNTRPTFQRRPIIRIHPLLAWSELDIWRYIERESIPVVPLYFAKDGKRYRSLGEKDITFPIASTASTIQEIIIELETTREPERAGRGMDHEREDAFEALRSSGYM
jgi:3'-phosphoadenosine 5'-phosphosulfate sulfotransferase (PAPS reductase)/FAD synthetase